VVSRIQQEIKQSRPFGSKAQEAMIGLMRPADLVRHDNRFAELGLDAGDYTQAAAVVDLLVEHPELMQRPVLVSNGRAIIARPPAETVPAFLD